MALAVLVLFGVLAAAILGLADAGQRATTAVEGRRQESAAAAAALTGEIASLRGDITLGRDGVACPSFTLGPATVTCTPQAGSGAGTSGQTVTGDSINALSGSSWGISITNDSFTRIAGTVNSSNQIKVPNNQGRLSVTGDVNAKSSCDSARITATGTVACNQGGSFNATDANYTAAVTTRPTSRALPTCPAAGALTFTAGYYNVTASALRNLIHNCNKPVWFQPGAFYFAFSGQWSVNANVRMVAGTPLGWTPATGPPPATGGCDPNGPGTQFIFGSTARLGIDGSFDICGIKTGTQPPIAIYGRKTTSGSMTALSGCVTTGSCTLFESRNQARIQLLGGIYAPTGTIAFNSQNVALSDPTLVGGLTAKYLTLNQSPLSTATLVSAPVTSGPTTYADRVVNLTATIAGATVATAQVKFVDGGGSSPGSSVQVLSWLLPET
jgi:hypothetical protein